MILVPIGCNSECFLKRFTSCYLVVTPDSTITLIQIPILIKWPEPWKHATVTPVLKPGKAPLEVSSYRPASILCALSKVVEKVLQDQLSVVAESKILPQEQHGFRPGRNTETALATLLSAADQAKRNNKKAALVTFDFSSAFDTIDSRTLERRMEPWATREAISPLLNYLSDGCLLYTSDAADE